MASIYLRGNIIWIKWYNKQIKDYEYESTGYPDTKAGWQEARQFKKDLEAEQRRKKRDRILPVVKKYTLEEAFQHYLRNNTKKNKSTISEYKNFYNLFTETFPPSIKCTDLTKLKIEAWLIALNDLTYKKKIRTKDKKIEYIERPYSQNTIFSFNKNLKKFLGFLFEYSYIPFYFKLSKDVTTPMKEPIIIIFNDEDIPKIVNNLEKKSLNFKMMIYLFLYSGLRPIDILDIKVEDIFLDREVYQYLDKLGQNKFRPFHPDIMPVLRERIKEIGSGKLFDYTSIDSMGRAFRRYLKDLGLDKKGYNLRTFRKTFETHFYENDGNEASAAELMGHSIETAARHYRKISTTRLKKDIQKFSLPGMKKEEVQKK